MTSKAQTMLTIALTAAVGVLVLDRIIEPAQAQNCAASWELTDATARLNSGISTISTDIDSLQRYLISEMELVNSKLGHVMYMVEEMQD